MNEHFQAVLLKSTGASSMFIKETIQSLWSGYGKIMRVALEGGPVKSVVVKLVQLPMHTQHPRGWNSDIGHQRKLKSYQVETYWYETYSFQSKARLPQCFAIEQAGDEVLMVLEDLDTAGFPLRKSFSLRGNVNSFQDIMSNTYYLA